MPGHKVEDGECDQGAVGDHLELVQEVAGEVRCKGDNRIRSMVVL